MGYLKARETCPFIRGEICIYWPCLMTPPVNHCLPGNCCAVAEQLERQLGDKAEVSGARKWSSSDRQWGQLQLCEPRCVSLGGLTSYLQGQGKAEGKRQRERQGGKETESACYAIQDEQSCLGCFKSMLDSRFQHNTEEVGGVGAPGIPLPGQWLLWGSSCFQGKV